MMPLLLRIRTEMAEEAVQLGESDRVARKRIAFQRAHKDTLSDPDKLAAYAAVYANIATLGCVYPKAVMERIEKLGQDVEEEAVDAPEMRSLVLASRSRKHAAKQREDKDEGSKNENPPQQQGPPRGQGGWGGGRGAHQPYQDRPRGPLGFPQSSMAAASGRTALPPLEERLKGMRDQLLLNHHAASGVSMLDSACKRLNLNWTMNTDSSGTPQLMISGLIALSFPFADKKQAKEQAVNAAVDAFLETGGPCTIDAPSKSLLFAGRGPEYTYPDSVARQLRLAAKALPSGVVSKKALTDALGRANLPSFEVEAKHMQGWEQLVQLRCADLILKERTLKKGECIKAKMEAAIEGMCAELAESIRTESYNVTFNEGRLALAPK